MNTPNSLFLDLSSGVSGDMFVAALIDLGVPFEALKASLGSLPVGGYHLHVSSQTRGAIHGTKFDVHLDHGGGHDHGHDHDHHHHETAHTHASPGSDKGATGPNSSSGSGLVSSPAPIPVIQAAPAAFQTLPKLPRLTSQPQAHTHPHTHTHAHAHTHDHDHSHGHGHEHGHSHGHGHEDGHAHGHGHEHEPHRDFRDIQALIQGAATLSDWVKEKAIAVFRRVAEAEGKVHGLPAELVHFHEVGAMDSIVDIVGACLALEALGKPRVFASTVVEGTGYVRCAHGRLPLPAPATLEILAARRVAIQQCDEPNELVTPTGAAIVAEFVESFGSMPAFIPHRVGYGLGTRQNKTRPNALRATLGQLNSQPTAVTAPPDQPAFDWESDQIAVLETNLDDLPGEQLGFFLEKAMAAGALDVFHTSIQMKKNRPAVLLTVLCDTADADRFSELILRNTSAFGVRKTTATRRKLRREFHTAQTPYGPITVKHGTLNGELLQLAPEYESCRVAAEAAKVPLKTVVQAAIQSQTAPPQSPQAHSTPPAHNP